MSGSRVLQGAAARWLHAAAVTLLLFVVTACGGRSVRRGGDAQGGASSAEGGSGASSPQGGSSTGGAGGTQIGAGGAGGTSTTGGSAGAPVTGGAAGSGATAGSGGMPGPEPPIAPCVTAAVPLPWATADGLSPRQFDFELVPLESSVAVVRTLAYGLVADVRTAVGTYALDGTELGQRDFPQKSRFVADGGFRGSRFVPSGGILQIYASDGVLAGLLWGVEFARVQAVFSLSYAESPLLGAVQSESSTIVLSELGFVNATRRVQTSWAEMLSGTPNASPPTSYARIYGLTSQGGQVLFAWGQPNTLQRAVVDETGALVAYRLESDFFGTPGHDNAVAYPFDQSLLLLHGNPIRSALLDFDITLDELGTIENFRPFYRSAPALGFLEWNGHSIGVWFAVAPTESYYDGATPQQIVGCELDLGVADACYRRFPIAQVDLSAYLIGEQPLAATLVGESTLAVAHTDTSERAWLRFVNLECVFVDP